MDAPGLIPSLVGAPLVAADGVPGTVEDLLVEAVGHRRMWLLVRLRHCALPYTFVPADRMLSRRDGVAVPFEEAVLRAAPVRLAAPGPVTREQAARLSRHYGLRAARIAEAVALHPARPALALAS
jgi:hypothetical protein